MEKEQTIKPSKNKADTVDKHGKNKKISDFFTTPDKNTEKQKQKSLLQFFTKSASKEKPAVDTVVDLVDSNEGKAVVGSDGVTTPNNSDKENSETVVTIDLVKETDGNNLNKSKKKQLFSQISGCNDKGKAGKANKKSSVKDLDNTDVKKHKKPKKNKPHNVGEDSDNLSDSAVILSDSSQSGWQHAEVTDTNLTESVVLKSQSKDKSKSSKLQSGSKVKENDKKISDVSDKSECPSVESDKKLNEEGQIICKYSDIKVKESVLADEMNISTVGNKDDLPKSKKTALKGKDMLNLLKEIQSTEIVCAKKKKHKKKHKHKHKDKLDVEVHEISQHDNVSDEDEASKLEGCKNEHETEASLPNHQIVDEDLKSDADQLLGKKKSTKLSFSSNLSTTDDSQGKMKKEKSSRKEKGIDVAHTKCKEKSKNLSYDTFTKKFETEKDDLQTTPAKEMSYSDYLKLMQDKEDDLEKKSKAENDEEGMECDDVIDIMDAVSNDSADNASLQCKIDEKNDIEAGDRNKDISSFFKVMTSTPARTKKGNKKNKCSSKADFVEMDISKKVLDVKENNIFESEGTVDAVDCVTNKKAKPLNGKGTQATLCFGKTGLIVSKSAVKPDETSEAADADFSSKKEDEGDNVSIKTVKRKPGRPRKSRIDTLDLNGTDSSVFATPEVVQKRKTKRRVETSSDMDSESADSTDRRRSLRKRYKVEAFQMDSDNKTPIKIKLKRCPKSSSSGEDFDRSLTVRKLKTNNKQTAAQALLHKAKRGKLKKHMLNNKDKVNDTDKAKPRKLKKKHRRAQNESNSSEDSVTRRSSRLEGKIMASMEEVSLENIVISSSDDEENGRIKVQKRGRQKKYVKKLDGVSDLREKIPKKGVKGTDVHTPTKDKLKKNSTPVKNSPKKAGVKLAPMFLKGKNKVAEASPKKTLDPVLAKQRQQFLMSGVPEALRKQNAVRMASVIDADYPPFPKHNHVLQMPSEHYPIKPGLCDAWYLKCVNLPTRRFNVPQYVYPMSRFTGDLMNSYQSTLNDLKHFKNFSSHEKLTENIVENCLKEIQSYNSSYPARTMYKSLLEMKTECEKPSVKSESMLKTDMKGILDGCTDMAVIDIDDDQANDVKKKKKSLKLQKKEQNEQKIDAKEVVDKPKLAGCGMLWTEKYCPIKSSEILGNSIVMKKLKTWLTEWKHVLDREARKARKLLLKKNKGKLLPSKKDADGLWDDDSDFDMNSDDSDDDNSLCNTMLLTGPHGCGKTSSVYALALELGFKVHEVNTSSCRSGKQILSQLQEATQSHQVTTQGSLTPRKNTALVDQTKTENKMPKSFTNLFKKADNDSQEKPDVKDGGKKRKRNKSDKDNVTKLNKKLDCVKPKALQLMIEDSNSQTAANCLNLSSTTLILFDEVDIVFEEDKGFLSAIQNFMSKTKIPILLTSTDPGFIHTFEGRYEVIHLKRPSMASIASHLQTVSLVENVRLETNILLELVQLYDCDVRKCLTMLQFLLLSGGGHSQTHKPFQISNLSKTALDRVGLDADNSQSSFDSVCKPEEKTVVVNDDNSKNSNLSDDDFVCIKPLKKRRRVIDEDSNSVDTTNFSVVKPNNVLTMEKAESDSLSAVHCIGVETLFRNGNLSVADTVTQGLKSKSSLDLKDMVCTSCCILRTTKSDVFYDNLHLFLPFSFKTVNSVYCEPQGKPSDGENRSRRRIKLNNDLYDSETSNDYSGPNLTETDPHANGNKTQDEEKDSNSSREESLCIVQSLSSFSRLYDTFSCLDVLETKDRMKIVDSMQSTTGLGVTGNLVPGVDSQLQQHERYCETDLEMCETYLSEIKSRSVCKFYRESEASKQTVESLSGTNTDFEENFVLPVMKQCEHFSLVDRSRICISGEYNRACDNVRDNLPLLTYSQQRTRHLDYLPSLREICRTEQCRQITNTKRRFHHYLDNITLSLKDRTISTLATTLT